MDGSLSRSWRASWRRLLLWALPEDARDDIVGDLDEETAARLGRGERVALWYASQSIRLSASFACQRFAHYMPRGLPPRRPVWFVPGYVRFGARQILNRPGWSLLVVSTLGLGIGLAAIAFSIVYGAVYRGLPFDEAHELVHFERLDVDEGRNLAVTPHDYEDWSAQQQSFEDLGAYVDDALVLNDSEGRPERATGVYISANSFALLRARAALGRTFSAEEDRPGGPAVLLIGHNAWQSRYGGDPEIIGRTVRVNGEPTTILGVMEPGFAFPIAEQFWLPLRNDTGAIERGRGRLDVFGRLAPGATIESARIEFRAIAARLGAAYPATNGSVEADLKSMTEEYVGREFVRLVTVMFVGAILVLVIACTNVGTLIAARATERDSEMALRTALGANRPQLVTQLLTETALLCTAGAILGVLAAYAGLQWFNTSWSEIGDFGLPHGPDGMFWWRFELDTVPLVFVLSATIATVMGTGLLPALHAAKGAVTGRMRRTGRSVGPGSVSARLVAFEVALTMCLLVAAALTILSVRHLANVSYGFRIEEVSTARIGLPSARYPDERSRRSFWAELERRLDEFPEVQHTAIATTLPARRARVTMVDIRGRPAVRPRDLPRTRTSTVNASFFESFGVTLLEGRAFDVTDREDSRQVVIVNESFAKRHFPGESALGKEIRVGPESAGEPWRIVVGVAPNVWMDGLTERGAEGLYLPLSQSRSPYGVGLAYLNVALAARGDAGVETLRTVVSQMDPELPVYGVRSMPEIVEDGSNRYRTYGAFYVIVGAVALFLACLGLYGVLSTQVARASHDIGVRMAFGASRRNIVWLYVRQGMRSVAVGIVLGSPLAYLMMGGIEAALFDIEPRMSVFAVVAFALVSASVLACAVPARRAAQIAPMAAVRQP